MKIRVKVKPNSGKQEIEEKDGVYFIKLKSSPVNNKANVELIKLLSKHFKKNVSIRSGFTSRNKIVEVFD